MRIPRIASPGSWPAWLRNSLYGLLSAIGITVGIVIVSAALQGRLLQSCRHCEGKRRFSRLTVIIPRITKQSLPSGMPRGFMLGQQEYLWCFRCWDGYHGVFDQEQEPVELQEVQEYFEQRRAHVA